MLIDLHFRFSPSETAYSEFNRIIESARERGLDGLCACLPPTVGGCEKLVEAGKDDNFPVFIGRSFKTPRGEIIGIFPDCSPVSEKDLGDVLSSPQMTLNYINKKNGVAVITQPYSRNSDEPVFQDGVLDLENVHCIEVINHCTKSGAAEMAMDVAVNLRAKLVAGGEDPEQNFQAGVLLLNNISSQDALVAELKKGGDYWVFVLGRDPIRESRRDEGRRPERGRRERDRRRPQRRR
ncbi:MAG: hypothetical protein Kow0090_16160 [Myxococcota bacterium]